MNLTADELKVLRCIRMAPHAVSIAKMANDSDICMDKKAIASAVSSLIAKGYIQGDSRDGHMEPLNENRRYFTVEEKRKEIEEIMNSKKEDKAAKVWYCCYGSNLDAQRFECYIKGGKAEFQNLKCDGNRGCADKTLPEKSEPYSLRGDIVFAKNSGRWDKKGVAFFDPSGDKEVLGRLWLVIAEQFAEIWGQEGDKLYGRCIPMGRYKGYEIKTITNPDIPRLERNHPSVGYIKTIIRGLIETYPEKTCVEAAEYLSKFLSGTKWPTDKIKELCYEMEENYGEKKGKV